jgi:uncharacterized protein involved in exopolysaccharide biosynthesis
MDPLKATTTAETKLHFLDYWRIIRIRKTIILAVFLLVVVTAAIVTLILPESYSSKARIRIQRAIPPTFPPAWAPNPTPPGIMIPTISRRNSR